MPYDETLATRTREALAGVAFASSLPPKPPKKPKKPKK